MAVQKKLQKANERPGRICQRADHQMGPKAGIDCQESYELDLETGSGAKWP